MGVGNTDHEISAEEYNRIKGLDPSMQLEALDCHGSCFISKTDTYTLHCTIKEV